MGLVEITFMPLLQNVRQFENACVTSAYCVNGYTVFSHVSVWPRSELTGISFITHQACISYDIYSHTSILGSEYFGQKSRRFFISTFERVMPEWQNDEACMFVLQTLYNHCRRICNYQVRISVPIISSRCLKLLVSRTQANMQVRSNQLRRANEQYKSPQ